MIFFILLTVSLCLNDAIGSTNTTSTANSTDETQSLSTNFPSVSVSDSTFKSQLYRNEHKNVGGGKCNTPYSCGIHGVCSENRCFCFEEYGGVFCDTKQKKQDIALFLTVCFGFVGFSRIYLGFVFLGVLKLLSFTLAVASVSAEIWFRKSSKEEHVEKGTMAVTIITVSGFAMWYMIDIVLIAGQNMCDSDGIGLYNNI